MKNSSLLPLILAYAMMENSDPFNSNFPKINKDLIDPPQSEESKQYWLKKAEEKRKRKKAKHKKGGLKCKRI